MVCSISLIAIAVLFSIAVNISVSPKSMFLLFRSNTNLYDPYVFYEFPVLVMIYSIAFNVGAF